MQSLRSLLAASPVALFLYGALSSLVELANTLVTLESIRFGATGSAAERIISARAIVFSFDNFFFYTGLAALVWVAVDVSEVRK